MLVQDGTVKVAELVTRFQVAAPTIRRDLGWLAAQGLARRVHGGAIALDKLEGSSSDTAAVRIGQTATDLVKDGETLFIGPGHLTLQVARAVARRSSITVITNGLAIARQIAQVSHNLILTGGQLEGENQALVGQLARATLENLRADRLFLEMSGVSAVTGLTTDSLPQAELAEHLLGLDTHVVILVAAHRVGRTAAAYVAPASEADMIITAREVDAAPLWDLTEMGVQVMLA